MKPLEVIELKMPTDYKCQACGCAATKVVSEWHNSSLCDDCFSIAVNLTDEERQGQSAVRLATNVFFAILCLACVIFGLLIMTKGNILLGLVVWIGSVISFWLGIKLDNYGEKRRIKNTFPKVK